MKFELVHKSLVDEKISHSQNEDVHTIDYDEGHQTILCEIRDDKYIYFVRCYYSLGVDSLASKFLKELGAKRECIRKEMKKYQPTDPAFKVLDAR